jgi:hypothetical protein
MGTPLPSEVRSLALLGDFSANENLKRRLVTTWNLVPDPHAFRGVASGNDIDCPYDDLTERYSRDSDSYRAVGIDAQKNVMVVYFYNG